MAKCNVLCKTKIFKFGIENALFRYCWAVSSRTYPVFQNAKLCEKIKSLTLGPKIYSQRANESKDLEEIELKQVSNSIKHETFSHIMAVSEFYFSDFLIFQL